jgi:hypothetical protein
LVVISELGVEALEDEAVGDEVVDGVIVGEGEETGLLPLLLVPEAEEEVSEPEVVEGVGDMVP